MAVTKDVMSKPKLPCQNFPGDPVAKILCSQCRGPILITGSGNQILHAATKRSHRLQWRSKIPHTAAKTKCSQTNIFLNPGRKLIGNGLSNINWVCEFASLTFSVRHLSSSYSTGRTAWWGRLWQQKAWVQTPALLFMSFGSNVGAGYFLHLSSLPIKLE